MVLSGACPVLSDRKRAEENSSQTHEYLSICMHLQCAGAAVTRLCILFPPPTPAWCEPHLGCEQRVKYGAGEGFGRYGGAEARKTPSHTPDADSPERTATSRQQINSNK